ncbi:hypothetical protein I5R31_26695 [Pseudomonas aeruginosa]|nr:hypothetical protein [Pseudomonas aeruginosa]
MSNELTDVRCHCGAEFPADSYDAGFIAGSGMCQNCDAAMPPKDIPALAEQAGGDERAAFEAAFAAMGRPVCRADYDQDAYGTPFDDGGWTGWQARAALAQPSQSQYEASFEEWLANELEGEDGQPVPAAVCDITLARRAFNHWPKLEQPAKVGSVRFSAGVSSRLVVEAAQRLYEFESTPEKEAERPEVVATMYTHHDDVDFREFVVVGNCDKGCEGFYGPEKLMTVAQHERIVGELRADRDSWAEQAEQRLADWDEMRKERDAALVEVERLSESKGDPVGSFEKCMKVMYERDENAKRLEVALARVAEYEAQAQHSVPGNAAALVRAEAKKYSLNAAGMLDSGAPEHAQTFAIVQLLSEFDDEEAESHWEAIMAYSDFRTSDALFRAAELLAAAPGKEVGHE